jgi:hypothetical protein
MYKGVIEGSLGEDGESRTCTDDCDKGPEPDLTCMGSCEYCSDDLMTCGVEGFGFGFNREGNITSASETFEYVKGRSELVMVESSECAFDMALNELLCLTCVVEVDGKKCDSCVVNTCAGGSQQISADCSNIEDGAVYDLCDENLVVPVGSLFEFLSNEGEAFDECFLTGSVIPSDAPSLVPSGLLSEVPSDMPSLVPTNMVPTMSPKPTTTATPPPVPVDPSPTSEPAPTDREIPTPAPSSSAPAKYTSLFFSTLVVLFPALW